MRKDDNNPYKSFVDVELNNVCKLFRIFFGTAFLSVPSIVTVIVK